jgi:S-formylglutathione hydrolase FrmB
VRRYDAAAHTDGKEVRMRTRRRWLRVLLLAVALAVVAFGLYVYTRLEPRGSQRVVYTPAARTCETAPEGFTFCVFRAAQGTDGRVVYHLHGRNLDATAWNDDTYYTSMIQARWAELGRTPPVVVGVSFGNLWLLAEKNPAPRSGLLEVFRDRVLPAVEARIGPPRARVLLGESMGGINALAAGLALPGTFTRVVSLCPTLFETSPFADDAAVEAALEATGADPKRVLALRHIADEYFADEAAWRAFSPNERVRPPASAPANGPDFYVSVGLYDAYGSYAGALAFVRDARSAGHRVTWRPLYGGHCAVDVDSVALALLGD